jgi:ribosomal protein S12 methylthiotransferase accessory factor YcaO
MSDGCPTATSLGCAGCADLWRHEAVAGDWPHDGSAEAVLLHPFCTRARHRPVTADLALADLAPPRGPVIQAQVTRMDGLDCWVSDVATTVPPGTRRYPAVVGGGAARTAERALAIGWTECVERRSMLRRPAARVRLVARPLDRPDSETPVWSVEAAAIPDGERVWVSCARVTLASQNRGGLANSTGVAAHPDRDRARHNGLRECVERAGLAAWWTTEGSRRCGPHTAAANERLDRLGISGSSCEVWHVSLGRLQVFGCLICDAGPARTRVTLGSAAAVDVADAFDSAFREATQLAAAPVLTRTPSGVSFGAPYVGHPVPADYMVELRSAFPAGDCPGAEPASGDETLDDLLSAAGGEAYEFTYRDRLTEALGLHVLRVWCPRLPTLSRASRSPSGLPALFVGG